jgi:hypothetical protein
MRVRPQIVAFVSIVMAVGQDLDPALKMPRLCAPLNQQPHNNQQPARRFHDIAATKSEHNTYRTPQTPK